MRISLAHHVRLSDRRASIGFVILMVVSLGLLGAQTRARHRARDGRTSIAGGWRRLVTFGESGGYQPPPPPPPPPPPEEPPPPDPLLDPGAVDAEETLLASDDPTSLTKPSVSDQGSLRPNTRPLRGLAGRRRRGEHVGERAAH